jgi:pyruvate-formate lyase-activating enzyme
MLEQIHFLLTYTCNYECDHCFLYCSPRSSGTFTLAQIENVLTEAGKLGSVKEIWFEGGEPLLYFPLLVRAVELSHDMGFRVGMVTNAYMSTTTREAGLWLKPLVAAGIDSISMSDDQFHCNGADSPASRALQAARELGVGSGTIKISRPTVLPPGDGQEKGGPVIGGGALFKGRAVEKLITGLPTRDWGQMKECPHERLREPKRVHVDALGNVHICQGISMGNMWQTPLSDMVLGYQPEEHPVCGPLLLGGPAELVRTYDLEHESSYVDECHLCFLARKSLLERFPAYLGPGQVYGV